MKLFKVELAYTIMVMAETAVGAEIKAESVVGYDGTEVETAHATEISSEEQIPEEWKESLPFGDKSEMTCRDRVNCLRPEPQAPAMTSEEALQNAAAVEAHQHGKPVEYAPLGTDEWRSAYTPRWSFQIHKYRPEPTKREEAA